MIIPGIGERACHSTHLSSEGKPDYALFSRQPGSAPGFVEGRIGKIWFGIDAEGRAHS